MKNIGILETHFHIKLINTLMKICKTEKTNVTVFTTPEIYSRIKIYIDDKSKYEIVLKEEDESINNYLKRVEKICEKKIDLLFVNTIQMSMIDIPHFIGFKPKSKMILTVHVTNHFLRAKFAYKTKNIIRAIDVNLGIFLLRNFVLKNFDAINVIYSPLKKYIEENTKYDKPIFEIPYNFYDETRKIKPSVKDEKIRIIVPGLIEKYRRDYEIVFSVFEEIFKKHGDKVILHLLGKPVGLYGENIYERCEKLKNKGYNVFCSKSFIPEVEFDKISSNADVIFSPIKVKAARDTGIVEIYGVSEGSALPFEAVQYQKPLIVPENFNIIDEIKSSTLKYKSRDDLFKIFDELITNKSKLSKLKNEAVKNSEKMSLKVLKRYFEDNVLKLV